MGDLVNLNKARKARDKAAKAQAAKEHRALHGQTKGEKLTLKARLEKARREIEALRLDKPPKE